MWHSNSRDQQKLSALNTCDLETQVQLLKKCSSFDPSFYFKKQANSVFRLFQVLLFESVGWVWWSQVAIGTTTSCRYWKYCRFWTKDSVELSKAWFLIKNLVLRIEQRIKWALWSSEVSPLKFFYLHLKSIIIIQVIISLKIVNTLTIITFLIRIQFQTEFSLVLFIFEFLFTNLRQYSKLICAFQSTQTIFAKALRKSIVCRYLQTIWSIEFTGHTIK